MESYIAIVALIWSFRLTLEIKAPIVAPFSRE